MENNASSVVDPLDLPKILKKILNYIDIEEIYVLRLVSKMWRDFIDEFIIPRDYLFHIDLGGLRNFGRRGSLEELNKFVSMKLSNVRLSIPKGDKHRNVQRIIRAFQTFGIHGKQIKKLYLDSMRLKTEGDFFILKSLAISMPNLEKLEIIEPCNFSIPQFLKFDHVFKKCKDVFLSMNHRHFCPVEEEAFVNHVLKVFPNLSENFGDPHLDKHLFPLLQNQKCLIKKIDLSLDDGSVEELNLVRSIPLKNVPLVTKLEIMYLWNHCGNEDLVIKVVQHFALILQFLALTNEYDKNTEITDGTVGPETVTISVPPLPKVRILHLGMPRAFNGRPTFLWDLGNGLAESFPFLQELEFAFKFETDVLHGDDAQIYSLPSYWSVWEPFLPILREKADSSPLKHVRLVNLSVPTKWLLRPENEEWKQAFLAVFTKLYGQMENCVDYNFVRLGGVS